MYRARTAAPMRHSPPAGSTAGRRAATRGRGRTSGPTARSCDSQLRSCAGLAGRQTVGLSDRVAAWRSGGAIIQLRRPLRVGHHVAEGGVDHAGRLGVSGRDRHWRRRPGPAVALSSPLDRRRGYVRVHAGNAATGVAERPRLVYGGLNRPASPTDMDFRILGPLEVLDEGHAVTLGGSKQRALLALLLVHANETLTTDRLIDELWGESPPANAAKTVQMHGLTAAQGARGRCRRRPDRDARARLRAAARSRAARFAPFRAAYLPRARASSLRAAPSRPRQRSSGRSRCGADAPLADLAYEPFAQNEIARLEDLRVGALEQLIEAKLALGRHAEVIAQLEALIADHPYRERLRAQLMLALYRCDARPTRCRPTRTHAGTGRGAGDRARRAPARARAGDTRPGPGARGAGGSVASDDGGGRGLRSRAPRAAHGRGHLHVDGHRGLVGFVGGRSRGDGGGARAPRRADRAHR